MTDHDYEPVQATVLAKHVSVCPICSHRILPGEEITSDEGTWVHRDCHDGFDDEGRLDDLGDAA